jgi:hypothetical protein
MIPLNYNIHNVRNNRKKYVPIVYDRPVVMNIRWEDF